MKKTVLTLLLLAAGWCATAQPTLEQCHTLAREHYPAIRQYDLVSQSREFTLSNAAKAWLPQVNVGAQATWQNADATFPETLTGMMETMGMEIPGIRKFQYQLSVQADQTLWDGGRTRAQKELAAAESAEQAGSVDVDFYALEGRINELYFGILMLDNRIGRTESLLSLLGSNLEQVRAMVRGGVAMQADADALEAECLGAEQTLARLRSTRESYRRVLSLFIGSELGKGDLPEPPMPSRTVQAPRPELKLLDAKIRTADARETMEKAAVLPRFSLFAQSWYGYPGLDMFKSMTTGDPTFNAIVGLRMSWNVSAFYTRSNHRRQLEIAREQARVQKDIFSFNTTLQQVQLDAELDRLQETLATDERIAELRRSVRQGAESRYRNGVIPMTELLSAIHEEDAAENARAADALELLKTAYELKYNAL